MPCIWATASTENTIPNKKVENSFDFGLHGALLPPIAFLGRIITGKRVIKKKEFIILLYILFNYEL